MTQRRIRPHETATKIGEALGISHLFVTNLVIFVGEFTRLFQEYGAEHGGVRFVMRFIDAPIYSFFEGKLASVGDKLIYFMWVEFILILSSLFYGFVCYLIGRFVFSLFKN